MNERNGDPIGLQSAQPRETFLANAPWKATSVLAAGGAAVAGLTALFGEQMSFALTRGGASYIGGYLVGWTMRRAMKLAALIAGLILAAIASLKSAGSVDLDWTSLESHVSQSLSWLNGKAEGLKTFLTSWLPSAGAGGAGVYFGFRRK
jgi:uncharacterized membrane protein (Fun14 family)